MRGEAFSCCADMKHILLIVKHQPSEADDIRVPLYAVPDVFAQTFLGVVAGFDTLALQFFQSRIIVGSPLRVIHLMIDLKMYSAVFRQHRTGEMCHQADAAVP